MPSRPVQALVALTALIALTALGLPAPHATAAPAVPAPDVARATAPYVITPFHPRASDRPRLVRAWRAWRAQHRTHYVTLVARSCECVQQPPVRTEVDGRRAVSVRFQGRERELNRHGYEVAELYRLLRRGYAEADAVSVRFRHGVPRWIYIDWDRMMADEETLLGVTVR